MADDKKDCGEGDSLQMGPELPGGTGARLYVRHRANHDIETGVIRPVKEGEPVNSCTSLLHLTHQEGSRFHVESLYESSEASEGATSSGPAQVATDAYRSGWDAIFGPRPVGQA